MSGAFPISTAAFQTLGIRSIQNTLISKSISGKKLSRQVDNQRFAFTARIITAKLLFLLFFIYIKYYLTEYDRKKNFK